MWRLGVAVSNSDASVGVVGLTYNVSAIIWSARTHTTHYIISWQVYALVNHLYIAWRENMIAFINTL